MNLVRPEAKAPESRVLTIDGQRVRVFEQYTGLPPTLGLLLNGGFDATGLYWRPLEVLSVTPVRVKGARGACSSEQNHRLQSWVKGRFLWWDRRREGEPTIYRERLDLHLQMCVDCEGVRVDDLSLDTDVHYGEGVGFARRPQVPWRRRARIHGWYTGARPRQRIHT